MYGKFLQVILDNIIRYHQGLSSSSLSSSLALPIVVQILLLVGSDPSFDPNIILCHIMSIYFM